MTGCPGEGLGGVQRFGQHGLVTGGCGQRYCLGFPSHQAVAAVQAQDRLPVPGTDLEQVGVVHKAAFYSLKVRVNGLPGAILGPVVDG